MCIDVYGFKTYRYYMGLWVLCMGQKYMPLLLCGVWVWIAACVFTQVCILVVLGLIWYNRPQLRMVIPFGISKFFDVVCTL